MDIQIERQAAGTIKPYDNEEHLDTLYRNAPKTYAFRATDQEELSAWQAAFRPKLREALGLDNMAADLSGLRAEGRAAGICRPGQSRPGTLVSLGRTDRAAAILPPVAEGRDGP